MRRVFADTYFLLALLNERDADHARAGHWWERLCDDEIITTAWVPVDLADGMSRGHGRRVCAGFIDDLRSTQTIELIEPAAALLWRGFGLYRQRDDKEWSLTDCISFVMMADEGLTEALTGDRHFEQAGFKALLAQAFPLVAERRSSVDRSWIARALGAKFYPADKHGFIRKGGWK